MSVVCVSVCVSVLRNKVYILAPADTLAAVSLTY